MAFNGWHENASLIAEVQRMAGGTITRMMSSDDEVQYNTIGHTEGDDAIESCESLHFRLNEEGLSHRSWIRHSRGFNDNAIELQGPRIDSCGELIKYDDQILADGTADATVHHLNDLLICLNRGVLRKQIIVDSHIAKLSRKHS